MKSEWYCVFSVFVMDNGQILGGKLLRILVKILNRFGSLLYFSHFILHKSLLSV